MNNIDLRILKGDLFIREGNTGILYISDKKGNKFTYIPDCNLDKARALLLEFQEIKDFHGHTIKTNYYKEGYYWFPSMVSFLYWHLFYPYIMYLPILEKVSNSNTQIQFINNKKFFRIYSLITGKFRPNFIKTKLLDILVRINNKIVIRRFSYQLLFFRFTKNDFRSIKIRNTLKELGVNYFEIIPRGRIIETAINMLTAKPYYYYGNSFRRNLFNHSYDISSYSGLLGFMIEKAIMYVETTISGYIKEFRVHSKMLSKKTFKTFYGFDDSNGYIFPLLYACQQNKIFTIGHQHGAYVKRHASYTMENINPAEFKWYDRIIVWGDYWKKHLLKNSQVYSSEMFIIGSNKLAWDYSLEIDRDCQKRNVLIPYEHSTNSYKVGKYIAKLIDLDYNIYVKPRPDEIIEEQLEGYCLSPKYKCKIKIVDKIDPNFIKKIDIIAGTMTSLIFELLPYNKVIWIFDIEYKHLEDLIENNYAHKVKYDDLSELGSEYFQKTRVKSEYFFGSKDLKEIISKYVLNS